MVGFRFSALPENGLLKYFNFLYFNMMWVAWESRVWCQTECGVGRRRPPEAVYVSGIDRKQHWDRAWSGRPADRMSWHQDRPGRSLAMIEDAGLAAGDALVDIGGGTTEVAVLSLRGLALDRAPGSGQRRSNFFPDFSTGGIVDEIRLTSLVPAGG